MKTFNIYETLFMGSVAVPDDITEETIFPYMDEHDCWPHDSEVQSYDVCLVHPAPEPFHPVNVEYVGERVMACRRIIGARGCGHIGSVVCGSLDHSLPGEAMCPGPGYWSNGSFIGDASMKMPWMCSDSVASAHTYLEEKGVKYE